MQVGIDSFAAAHEDASLSVSPSERLRRLVEQIEFADQLGLDVFGVGEHHRQEFLDSAPVVILGAAAARTQRICLTSAVTVLSAADPVRIFQEFATLDLLSNGRAEMVVGRGSFIEAFPLFGLRLEDYDSIFEEKLDLLLKIRDNEQVYWSGKYRPALNGQEVYPRPVQESLPIWRRWDSRIIRPCRSAWTPFDDRNNRRGDANVQAADRSLQRGREASRPLTR
jgi:alkanesulfonate monooxygenase SsuD/methylene tetrahydromethanopterin reductase-like flavin-dependent oxidoreductase (luciferase family)